MPPWAQYRRRAIRHIWGSIQNHGRSGAVTAEGLLSSGSAARANFRFWPECDGVASGYFASCQISALRHRSEKTFEGRVGVPLAATNLDDHASSPALPARYA